MQPQLMRLDELPNKIRMIGGGGRCRAPNRSSSLASAYAARSFFSIALRFHPGDPCTLCRFLGGCQRSADVWMPSPREVRAPIAKAAGRNAIGMKDVPTCVITERTVARETM